MIEKNAPIPVYYQVKMSILDKIETEVYKVGEQLPTDMEFCDLYQVSRITVRRALSELEAEGYIERVQGKGSYVKFKGIHQSISKFYTFTEEIIKMGLVPGSIFVDFKEIKADENLAEKLRVAEGDDIYLVERLRLADKVIVAYDRSYIPKKIAPGFNMDMLMGGSLYSALDENFKMRPNNAEETLEAILVEEKDANKMRVPIGSPQLLVKRQSYHNDVLVEYNYRIVNSSVYKYRVNLEKI